MVPATGREAAAQKGEAAAQKEGRGRSQAEGGERDRPKGWRKAAQLDCNVQKVFQLLSDKKLKKKFT